MKFYSKSEHFYTRTWNVVCKTAASLIRPQWPHGNPSMLYKALKCSLQNGGQFDSASMTPWQSKYALQSIAKLCQISGNFEAKQIRVK